MTKLQDLPIATLSATAKMPDRVTAALLSLIRTGEYPPGARLPSEMRMATSFGVSRTVIREAVSRLKSEGLVESRQGSGVYVRTGWQAGAAPPASGNAARIPGYALARRKNPSVSSGTLWIEIGISLLAGTHRERFRRCPGWTVSLPPRHLPRH